MKIQAPADIYTAAYRRRWKDIAKIKGSDKTSYKVSGLDSLTQYKFRVKGYKTVDGKTVYGDESKIIAVKTN